MKQQWDDNWIKHAYTRTDLRVSEELLGGVTHHRVDLTHVDVLHTLVLGYFTKHASITTTHNEHSSWLSVGEHWQMNWEEGETRNIHSVETYNMHLTAVILFIVGMCAIAHTKLVSDNGITYQSFLGRRTHRARLTESHRQGTIPYHRSQIGKQACPGSQIAPRTRCLAHPITRNTYNMIILAKRRRGDGGGGGNTVVLQQRSLQSSSSFFGQATWLRFRCTIRRR
jgi:hypothetical protein